MVSSCAEQGGSKGALPVPLMTDLSNRYDEKQFTPCTLCHRVHLYLYPHKPVWQPWGLSGKALEDNIRPLVVCGAFKGDREIRSHPFKSREELQSER